MLAPVIEIFPRAMTPGHLPVMLHEVLEFLAPHEGQQLLDCTFGGGGHTRLLLDAGAKVVALDRDPAAADRAAHAMLGFADSFRFVPLNFGDLASLPDTGFNGILFDLGVSSYQLDDAERGFAFRHDAPVDMRMDPTQGQSAAHWLELASHNDLVKAIRDYGEEDHWHRVVSAIESARGTGRLSRTGSLAQVIADAIPNFAKRESRIHPATRSFQGIRIAVNDEIGAIERGLPAAFEKLAPGGILAVISFHSLEDRPVKHFFRKMCGMPIDENDSLPQQMRTKLANLLTRKPVVPSAGEIATNPRSRSAKLRVLRKL